MSLAETFFRLAIIIAAFSILDLLLEAALAGPEELIGTMWAAIIVGLIWAASEYRSQMK